MMTERAILPTITDGYEVSLKKFCLEHAMKMNPKDAGHAIRMAAGLYNWLTKDEKPHE